MIAGQLLDAVTRSSGMEDVVDGPAFHIESTYVPTNSLARRIDQLTRIFYGCLAALVTAPTDLTSVQLEPGPGELDKSIFGGVSTYLSTSVSE